MSEISRTLGFAGVAVALLAAAAFMSRLSGVGASSADFNDQGEPFFASFASAVDKDPLCAKVLEVVEYDPEEATFRPFQVEFQDGSWRIPSHHDYPAKAQDRIAKLAAEVASLRRESIRSDRAEDHEALGVIDPLDSKATSLRGRGTHVILRDRPGGQALADFIIGAEVPGRPGMRYVRQGGKNRTYATKLGLDLSTEFASWIDTNLIDVPTGEVTRIEYDTRKVDPNQLTVQPGVPILLEREKEAAGLPAKWTMADLEAGKEIDTNKVEDAIRAVDGLRVVGVRPLPQQSSNDGLVRSLASKGFYLTRQGELLSNEGSVRISTDAGIRYTLRFGEVTFATGKTLTSGEDEDKRMAGEDLVPKDESASKEGVDPKKAETESRFVIVTTEFDPALIPDNRSAADGIPEDVFARADDDPIRVEAEKRAKEEDERKTKEREQKIAAGQKKVDELNETLKNWYYVVPGADFRRVFVGRDGFLKVAGAETMAPATPGGMPAGLGGGLPPGLNLPELGGARPR